MANGASVVRVRHRPDAEVSASRAPLHGRGAGRRTDRDPSPWRILVPVSLVLLLALLALEVWMTVSALTPGAAMAPDDDLDLAVSEEVFVPSARTGPDSHLR